MDEIKAYKLQKLFHFIAALIFAAVGIVLPFLEGEFILVAEYKWILILFAILLIGNALFYVTPIRDKFWASKFGLKLKEKKVPKGWTIGTAILDLILGIVLLLLFGFIIFLTLDILIGVLSLAYIVAAIPFVGLSVLCVYQSVKTLLLFKNRVDKSNQIQFLEKLEHIVRIGMVPVGIIFMIILAMVGITLVVYNPSWTTGVENTPLFTAGEEGRDYRIPSLIVLPGDIILATAESRKAAMTDWGDNNLVMKRSTDGGTTWSNIITLYDAGDDTAGNQCPVFDVITNIVWMPFCINNRRVYVMNSSDYGVTWSIPWEITDQLNLGIDSQGSQLEMIYGTGPGIGIQLSHSGSLNGRLVIPCYYFDERGSHVIYSDDHGVSWQKGDNIPEVSGECQVFETVDGRLGINIRSSEGYRYIAWSTDGGETWSDATFDMELADPGCMASIIRYSENPPQTENRLLFSGPSQGTRGHLTIRLSYNEADTWTVSREIYSGASAYSQIGVLSTGVICVLFEQGRYDYRESIQFCRFTIGWLTNGVDVTY